MYKRQVQYAAYAYRQRLASLGIRQSMSRKGDPYDLSLIHISVRFTVKPLFSAIGFQLPSVCNSSASTGVLSSGCLLYTSRCV